MAGTDQERLIAALSGGLIKAEAALVALHTASDQASRAMSSAAAAKQNEGATQGAFVAAKRACDDSAAQLGRATQYGGLATAANEAGKYSQLSAGSASGAVKLAEQLYARASAEKRTADREATRMRNLIVQIKQALSAARAVGR